MNRLFGLALLCLALVPLASAETRSAQDMAKECRVALDLFQNRVEKSFENTLLQASASGTYKVQATFHSRWQTT